MTGWRIGMVVGNQQMVDALMRVKSNIDSGIPQAIQKMAIEAVYGPQDCIDEHNKIYERRRDRMVEVPAQDRPRASRRRRRRSTSGRQLPDGHHERATTPRG